MTDQTQSAAPGGASAYLIYDTELDTGLVEACCAQHGVALVPWGERANCHTDARVLTYVGDERVRDLAPLAMEKGWAVGVLPHPRARRSSAALGAHGDLVKLIKHYLAAPEIAADAMTCNGELVFNSVVIGRVLALRPQDINRPQTGLDMLKGALRGLSALTLRPYKLTTAKEREISMAALGIVVTGQTQSKLMYRAFADDMGIADGRLSMIALAPRSILSYLVFLLRLFMPGKMSFSRLPSSLSVVQTNRLHITAQKGTEYLLDGKPVHATEIEFEILEDKIKLLPGPELKLQPDLTTLNAKETVRLNHVPVDSAAKPLLEKPLPLFNHATEEEYRELFVALRENAASSASYQVLMVLSVLLALGGMYANSAPVIIGAMILAPLMSPIISLSMGLARSDAALMNVAGRTLLKGIAWGLGCGIVLAWAMPLEIPTAEMKARMSPTLLDLFVAVLSGIAGAYAHSREEIAKSLAGVAIAVALVPPLSVAGIGLGWGDWHMAWGASLLLVTNLIGIALAASLTFLMLGFAPFSRAKPGLIVTFVLALIICLPLTLSFSHLVARDRIIEHVPMGAVQLSDVSVNVSRADVRLGDPHLLLITLSSGQALETKDVDELKALIAQRVGEPIALEVQANIRR